MGIIILRFIVIFYVLGSLVDVYVLVGLVVLFLSYFKVLK